MPKVDTAERWQSKAVAESYDAERFESPIGRFFHWMQCRALRESLRKLPRTASIADIPCGTGRMLPILTEHAPSVIALDISEAMIGQANRRVAGSGQVQFILGDVRALPLGDNSVDVIVSLRFAMHLTPMVRVEVLREFARVTRGWIIVGYGCDSWWHTIRRFVRSLLLGIMGRRRSYPKSTTRREILNEAHTAGLDVRRWHWTLRGLSESVLVAMEIIDSIPATSRTGTDHDPRNLGGEGTSNLQTT